MSEVVLFAICNYDGRYAEGAADQPEEATEALKDWVSKHRGCQTFAERPDGWPDAVAGVSSNGHYRAMLGGKATCGGCAERWPCPDYVAAASQCPENGVNLSYPSQA